VTLGATDIEVGTKPAIRLLVNSMEQSTNRLERIITDLQERQGPFPSSPMIFD
jgi:hypothetical protein